MAHKTTPLVILLVLAAVCVGQLLFLIDGYGSKWLYAAATTWRLSGPERSARFYFGTNEARFIKFLTANVPSAASVVLPERIAPFSEQSILQFFLLPRGIPACGCGYSEGEAPGEECIACLMDETSYVPAVGPFPPLGTVSRKTLIPYGEPSDWFRGVYAPRAAESTELPVLSSTRSAYTIPVLLRSATLSIVALVGLWLLGALVSQRILQHLAFLDALSLGLPLGIGTLTWTVFLLSSAGIRVSLSTYAAVWCVLAVIAAAPALTAMPSSLSPSRMGSTLREGFREYKRHRMASLLFMTILVVILVAAIISVTRGYSTFDGIANWALKGYAIAYDGSVFAGSQRGGHSLAYPQNLHLAIALFKLLDNDLLPGSKLLFPSLSASLLLGSYSFFRKWGVGRTLASVGILAVLTIPIFFLHSTIGWANLPAAVYLVLGSLWLTNGLLINHRHQQALGGILLGFGSWTRPEGIGYALLILLAAVAYCLASRRSPKWVPWALAPLALIYAPYFIFSAGDQTTGNLGSAVRLAVINLSEGQWHWNELRVLLQTTAVHLAAPARWGFSALAAGLLVAAGFMRTLRRRDPPTVMILATAATILLATLFILYVRSFRGGEEDFIRFLDRSLDRHLLPGIVLLVISSVLGVRSLDSGSS